MYARGRAMKSQNRTIPPHLYLITVGMKCFKCFLQHFIETVRCLGLQLTAVFIFDYYAANNCFVYKDSFDVIDNQHISVAAPLHRTEMLQVISQ